MEVEYYPIGSFTVFINDDYLAANYGTGIYTKISEAIAEDFQLRLNNVPGMEAVVIVDVNTERGCIITTITLGAAVAAVTGGAYKFLLDYDKLHANLKLLISHLKNAYLLHKQKKRKPLPPPEFKILETIPNEFKKLYASGQDVVFYTNSEETVKISKISIMRDDIIDETEEHIIKKTTIVVKKK